MFCIKCGAKQNDTVSANDHEKTESMFKEPIAGRETGNSFQFQAQASQPPEYQPFNSRSLETEKSHPSRNPGRVSPINPVKKKRNIVIAAIAACLILVIVLVITLPGVIKETPDNATDLAEPVQEIVLLIQQDFEYVRRAAESRELKEWFADEPNAEKRAAAHYKMLQLLQADLRMFLVILDSMNDYYLDIDDFITYYFPEIINEQWFIEIMDSKNDFTLSIEFDFDIPSLWVNYKVVENGKIIGIINYVFDIDESFFSIFDRYDSAEVLDLITRELLNNTSISSDAGLNQNTPVPTDTPAPVDTPAPADTPAPTTPGNEVDRRHQAALVGFWTATDVDSGIIYYIDIAFGELGEYYQLVLNEDGMTVLEIEGRFEVAGDKIYVNGFDYVGDRDITYTITFNFDGRRLHLWWNNDLPPLVFISEPLPYQIFFDLP